MILLDLAGRLLVEWLLLPLTQGEVAEGSEHLLNVLHYLLLPLTTHDHVLALVGTRILAVGQLGVPAPLMGGFLVPATLVRRVLLHL